jgi:hypothetical protein
MYIFLKNTEGKEKPSKRGLRSKDTIQGGAIGLR